MFVGDGVFCYFPFGTLHCAAFLFAWFFSSFVVVSWEHSQCRCMSIYLKLNLVLL